MRRKQRHVVVALLAAGAVIASVREGASVPTWTTLPSCPNPHEFGAAVVAKDPNALSEDRIYAIDGSSNPGAVDLFNPAGSGSWTSGEPLDPPRRYHAAVTAPDGSVYVIGGENSLTGVALGTVVRYVPGPGSTWTSVDSLPGGLALINHAAVVAKDGHSPTRYDCIFVFGGRTGSGTVRNVVEKYYLTGPLAGTWETSSRPAVMPATSWNMSAALACNGKIYVAGGCAGACPGGLNRVDEFDPAIDTSPGAWATTPPAMSYGREHFGLASGSDGKLYAINGRLGPGPCGISDVESWDPSDATMPFWSPEASTIGGYTGVSAVALGNRIFAIGANTHGGCSASNPGRTLALGLLSRCSLCEAGQCQEDCAFRWTGPSGGTWSTGGSWTPGGPPSGAERALLENSGASGNICLLNTAGTTTVCGATVRGIGAGTQTLRIANGSTLSPTNGTIVDVNGIVELQGGTLSGGTPLVAVGGALRGYGNVSPVMTVNGLLESTSSTVDLVCGRVLFQPGSMTRALAGTELQVTGTPVEALAGMVDVQSLARLSFPAATVTIPSTGHVTINGGDLVVSNSLTCQSNLVLTNADVTVGVNFGNTVGGGTGRVDLYGSTTIVAGNSISNSANLNSQAGAFAALNVTSGNKALNNAIGTINLKSGSVTNFMTGLDNQGTLTKNGTCFGCVAVDDATLIVQKDLVCSSASTMELGETAVELYGNFDCAIDNGTRFDLAFAEVISEGG